MSGGLLIREARLRAGLTQRALAERIGRSQSQIARWEGGGTEPSWDSVLLAVRAAGFSVDVHLEPDDGSDLAQSRRLLAMSPRERMVEMTRAANRMDAMRKRTTG